jgi:hypothetical protein
MKGAVRWIGPLRSSEGLPKAPGSFHRVVPIPIELAENGFGNLDGSHRMPERAPGR